MLRTATDNFSQDIEEYFDQELDSPSDWTRPISGETPSKSIFFTLKNNPMFLLAHAIIYLPNYQIKHLAGPAKAAEGCSTPTKNVFFGHPGKEEDVFEFKVEGEEEKTAERDAKCPPQAASANTIVTKAVIGGYKFGIVI